MLQTDKGDGLMKRCYSVASWGFKGLAFLEFDTYKEIQDILTSAGSSLTILVIKLFNSVVVWTPVDWESNWTYSYIFCNFWQSAIHLFNL